MRVIYSFTLSKPLHILYGIPFKLVDSDEYKQRNQKICTKYYSFVLDL